MYLKNRRGVSFVEVIISIFMVAVITMIFGAIFSTGSISTGKVEYATYALHFAQRSMEQVRGVSFNNLVNGSQVSAVSNLPPATCTITISPYPDPSSVDLKKIVVNVTWSGPGKTGGTVELASLMANR